MTEPRPGPIDPRAILAELGISGAVAVIPVAANRGKGIWRVDGEDRSWALRVLRPNEDGTARHELAMMQAARDGGAPVPEVAATGAWRGRPVILLAWCPGRTLQAELRRRPWAAHRLGRACGRAQAALNGTPALTGDDPGAWIHRFGEVHGPLAERLAAAESGPAQLLHLDCHQDNVLLDRDGVTALLDWTNACGGDPRADLARSWSLLTRGSGRRGIKPRAVAALHRTVERGWRAGYEEIAGRQDDMQLFELWALEALIGTLREEARRWGSSADLDRLTARARSRRAALGLA